MYQHPQALELNARYYRTEARRAADNRRLVNSLRSDQSGRQSLLAERARDVEYGLILLTTALLAVLLATILLI